MIRKSYQSRESIPLSEPVPYPKAAGYTADFVQSEKEQRLKYTKGRKKRVRPNQGFPLFLQKK